MATRIGCRVLRLIQRRSDLPTLIESAACLIISRLILKMFSGDHAGCWLTPIRSRCLARSVDPETLARVRWAVQAAARYVPCRALCFERALAAQRMLLRRGFAAELVYGVARKPDGTIEAHVWTRVGRDTVVGGRARERFTPVAVFTPDASVVAYEEPAPARQSAQSHPP